MCTGSMHLALLVVDIFHNVEDMNIHFPLLHKSDYSCNLTLRVVGPDSEMEITLRKLWLQDQVH